MSSPAKKPRREGKSRDFHAKASRKSPRNHLDVGDKGWMVTCNFKEKDSIREVYRLLNEYYELSNPKEEPKKEEEDDDDIASQLQDQIDKSKQETKDRSHKFQSIETGCQNCVFIRTTIDDPVKLGALIVRDLAETKAKKTKFTLRMLPIETVCKARLEAIVDAGGLLFDKYFIKKPSTFSINFSRRYNSDIQRDDVIKALADLVALKNPLNKVNLKEPEQSVIVEIIKGHCLLSVLPDYLKLKKYNLNELWAKGDSTEDGSSQEKEDGLSQKEDLSQKKEAETEAESKPEATVEEP